MKILILRTTLTLMVLVAAPAAADFALGGRIGSGGVGIEAMQKFSPHFAARLGLSGLGYSFDFTYDDVEYDTETDFAIGSLLFDWHPGAGGFRLTAGATHYTARFDIHARPDPVTTYQIGNTSYTGAQLGDLNGQIEYRKFAPYVGAGWDFGAGKIRGLGFSVDVGVIYRDKPDDISLTASGNPAGITSALAQETRLIRDDTPTYHLLISAGLYYRF